MKIGFINNLLKAFLVILFVSFYCLPAQAALSTTVQTTDDTQAVSWNPNAVYGYTGPLEARNQYVYFKPDYTTLTGKLIVGCTFYWYSSNGANNYIYTPGNMYTVTSNWAQSSLTYNNSPGLGSIYLSFNNFAYNETSQYVWQSFDIGTIARTWNTNPYGLSAISGAPTGTYIWSKESGAPYQPYFVIYYFNPPGAISNGGATQTSINVTWGSNGNSGDAVYSLYRGGSLIYKGTSTSYNDTGLSAGTSYNYSVYTSYDADSTTYYSTSTSTSLITAPATPAAPTGTITGLSWSQTAGRGKVVLNWSAVTNATGYKIWIFDGYDYRSFNVGNVTTWDSSVARIYPDESWLNGQADNSISSDIFNHAGGGFDLRDDPVKLYIKTMGTTYDASHNYWFRVSAYNAYGESSYSNAYTPNLPNRTDTTVPSGTISVGVPDGATAPATVTVNLTSISDSQSGLYQMRFSNDNTTYSGWQGFSTSKSWTTSTGEGQKTVYAQVCDNVGNVATFSVNFWLGATLTQIYNESQSGAQKAEAARLAAEESKINSSAAKTAAEAASSNAGIAANNSQSAADRSYYTGRYGGSTESVADVSGYMRNTQLPALDTKVDNIKSDVDNINTTVTNINNAVSTDAISPTVSVKTLSGAVATSGGTINIIVTASDNRSFALIYSVNGGAYQALPGDGVINVPVINPGPNAITIRIKDEAGNTGVATIVIRKL